MEKNMEKEMETGEYIGIVWGCIGAKIGILIFRPLKGGGSESRVYIRCCVLHVTDS